ncbi:MAG: ABC transporter substrate-binding protein [Gammaproteobacteria bacterium]|nr:ABC transporter substrate-binding protein [Gammaproteobacteria bacterium]
MKRCLIFIFALCAGFAGAAASAADQRLSEISVGYSMQLPTPALFSRHKKTFDRALGLTVNWIPFESGNDMNAALAAGDLQIAYSQGHVPFLVAVTRGLELTMVGIAVGYPEDDNCIVRYDAGISRDNAAELQGKKVAVQAGSVSHYRMLRVLEHLGVDPSLVDIAATADGTATATALQHGDVVMACASGGALRAISTLGKPLMTGAEQAQIGLKLFDTVTVPTAFLDQHPEIVQAFMDVVEASNKHWKKNPEPMHAAIARAAQMNPEGVRRTLEGFIFPSALEQKSDDWLGSLVSAYSKDLADFFVTQGRLDNALESYDGFVTTRFLR